MGKKHLK
jgi:tetratricopeptide (TPR) repeat protein